MELEGVVGEIPSVHCRSFYPSAFGTQSSRSPSTTTVYSIPDRPGTLSPQSLNSFASLPNSANVSSSVAFGCNIGNRCYSYKIPQSPVFQQNILKQTANTPLSGHTTDKPMDMAGFTSNSLHCSDVQRRVKEFGVYQSYTGPYSRIPGYMDVPVVPRARAGDPRQEAVLPMECYQPWSWSSAWNGQQYCPKDQSQNSCIWKSPRTEDVARPDSSAIYRRGRKKRVPYTKLQLKELEREYSITKFITKEKRRRIASSTNLSEKQVTIWFQNRRVKDKKILSKSSKDFEPYH
ncbi:homeobox protein Hox-D13a [Chanos chanos]|uniref:Homeobox protein Hox-D13a n=1 Tax=Chanos chanos TaxID=29144 RepID=A0A6J2WDP6_CHACN|nr:homeobox protein Hox-D13-like [Chanos chanos]